MKSHAVIQQIVSLKNAGYPIKKIATILDISRNTVRRYLRNRVEEETQSLVKSIPAWRQAIDWESICKKRRQGYSVRKLYDDYEPDISYPRFCTHLRDSVGKTTEIALRIAHKPGEKVQVDFCDGPVITNRLTGEKKKTQLFVGVFPFSSLCFGLFLEDQKLPSFLKAHEAMWAFFGGVTPYVVVDNLKAGVKKAHQYDPELNPTYCDFANHYGFAVLPARPYKPRDKASVEANIGALQRSFFQEVRDKKFYNLGELNHDFRRFLYKFNHRPMQDYGVSRRQRFEVEKPKLLPLPETRFEVYEMRESKVHPDCCIQLHKCFYSVPYKYRGRTVRVKVTDSMVTVYDDDINAIACHRRSHQTGSVVSDKRHFPDSLLQLQSYDIQNAIVRSKTIGPKTHELVNHLISGDRPLRHLRRIQGLFRLLDQGCDIPSLEYACSQAITFGKFQLAYIKSCTQQYHLTRGKLELCRPSRDPGNIYIRGGYDV